MNNALVEEVAASLVREYLSRKAQEIPLKAMIEIIVKHCMENQNMTNTRTEDFLFQKNTVPTSRSSVMSSVSVCDVSDEEKGGSTAVSNQSKTDVYRSSDDIACTSYKLLSYKTSQSNSKISATCVGSSASSSEGERGSQQRSFSYAKDSNSLKVDVLSTEIKNAFTELQKPRSSRIVRGMMAGPIACSQEHFCSSCKDCEALHATSERQPSLTSLNLDVSTKWNGTRLIVSLSAQRALRSADSGLLCTPRVRFRKKGDVAFCVRAPQLWNSVSYHVILPTVATFKSRLKTYLYNLAF
ncbi:UNVERIFIED_CONTAM: hypothetical protein FKN15_026406 [Acipenser sinensis]